MTLPQSTTLCGIYRNTLLCHDFNIFYFESMSLFPARVSVHQLHAVPVEARRGCWIPWNLSYKRLVSHKVGAGNRNPGFLLLITELSPQDSFLRRGGITAQCSWKAGCVLGEAFLFDWPSCSGSGKISIFPLTLIIDIALTVNKVAQGST